MSRLRALAFAAGCGLLAGCPFASLPDGGVYRCSADQTCPSGLRCENGYCVNPGTGGGSAMGGGEGGGVAGGAGGGLAGGSGGGAGGTAGGTAGGQAGGDPDGGADAGCTGAPTCQPGDCGVKANNCGVASCGDPCTTFQRCGLPWLPNRCAPLQVCTASGYCWENPLPQGNHLYGMALVGTEAWAVGARGTILRQYKNSFIEVTDPVIPPDDLNAISSANASDVWVVGNNATVLHFDGARWTKESPNLCASNFTSVWSAGGGVVFVGTNLASSPGCVLERSSAGAWSSASLGVSGQSAKVNGVHGGGGRVFAVSRDRVWERPLASANWVEAAKTDAGALNAVWGIEGRYFAAGSQGAFVSTNDAGQWIVEPNSGGDVRALFGRAADDAWAVGNDGFKRHFDGSSWTVQTAASPLLTTLFTGVSSISPDGGFLSPGAGFVAGQFGYMANIDALSSTDSPVPLGQPSVRTSLSTLSRIEPNLLVAGTLGGVVIRGAGSLPRWLLTRPADLWPKAVCHSGAGSTDEAFVACSDGYLVRLTTDAGWQAQQLIADAGSNLYGVAYPRGGPAWVVGNHGTVLMSVADGGWERQTLSTGLDASYSAVVSGGPTVAWGAGDYGATLRLVPNASLQNNNGFTSVTYDFLAAAALEFTPGSPHWFVGQNSDTNNPLVVSFARTTGGPPVPLELTAPGVSALWAVTALADDELWAVGDNGSVFHFTDAGVSVEFAPTSGILTGVLSLGDAGLLMVGDDGVVLRRRLP